MPHKDVQKWVLRNIALLLPLKPAETTMISQIGLFTEMCL